MAVYLPWNSQVPVTLQTHAVVLSGLLLGPRWALVSQAEYLAAGLLGAPVFAGLRAGPAVLFGPTGGYLVGFLASAWLAGLLAPSRASLRRRLVAAGAAIVVPYVFGVAWLYAAWRTGGTGEAALLSAVSLGVAPFLGVDLVKAAAAALVAQKAEA
jgi:biotin transport system substrate-specific component